MNNFNFDKYLNLVNDEKKKYGLDLYAPLYPMFRVQDNKLYIVVGLVNDNDNVWSKDGNVKPEYWALIDINSDKIIEFNKTEEKDFVIGNTIEKIYGDNEKEISKYTVEKTLQYKEYLKDDFKKFQTPLQKKLIDMIRNEGVVDGEKKDLNEYVFDNIEKEIDEKLNELVKMLVWDKYGSIVFYYDILYAQVIEEYKNNNSINNEIIKLCAEIMNNYYVGVTYIDNLFNA